MMTVDLQQEQKDNSKPTKRKSYFEYCVTKHELNGIGKLLIEKGYSISNAFKDAFKAGNYKQLFQVLESMDQNTVQNAVTITDEFGRNIFHSLSKAPDESPFNEICDILIKTYGLDPNDTDNQGNSPIMLACREGKLNLVKALECVGCNILDTNHDYENCIHMVVRQHNIKKLNTKLLMYLINKKVNFNDQYNEPSYDVQDKESEETKSEYKCTPLIHLIKTQLIEVWDKGDIIETIFKNKNLNFDPDQTDSDGRDIFMHCAILNEFDLCKYIIDLIKQNHKDSDQNEEGKNNLNQRVQNKFRNPKAKVIANEAESDEEMIVTNKHEMKRLERNNKNKNPEISSVEEDDPEVIESKYGISLSRVDNFGKSVIHYIVTPINYGSYENYKFLRYMLQFGFNSEIVDKEGKKAYEYSLDQSTGLMLDVFKDLKLAPKDIEVNEGLSEYKKIEDWEAINYQKDAQDFLDLVKMNVDKQDLIPCDPVGKFNQDCFVYEDPEKGHFDCHLTRVDIGREEKDDYLFYKMQIVHDKGRDLWMLFTRWGRIGEEGAFQKTPYGKQECIEEFEKVFFNKTKNEWKDRANFKKHWFKYQLINVNYSNVDHKDYLVPFDLSNSKSSSLSSSVQEAMKEITQVAMYVKGLRD